MHSYPFIVYLAVAAGVTYLVRMLPLVLIKRKIKNRFLLSFLHYIPYAVLAAMTVPACFYATGNVVSSVVGVAVALLIAWRGKSLLTVALCACAGALVTELAITYVIPLLS